MQRGWDRLALLINAITRPAVGDAPPACGIVKHFALRRHALTDHEKRDAWNELPGRLAVWLSLVVVVDNHARARFALFAELLHCIKELVVFREHLVLIGLVEKPATRRFQRRFAIGGAAGSAREMLVVVVSVASLVVFVFVVIIGDTPFESARPYKPRMRLTYSSRYFALALLVPKQASRNPGFALLCSVPRASSRRIGTVVIGADAGCAALSVSVEAPFDVCSSTVSGCASTLNIGRRCLH